MQFHRKDRALKMGTSLWVRTTSLGMAILFFYANILSGAIQPARTLWEERKTVLIQSQAQNKFSTDFADIKEIYNPPNSNAHTPFIIHIQDAHDQYEVQKNISSLLLSLTQKSQEAQLLVGIEGAEGAFEVEQYRSFPDEETTASIADYFLKESFISGPEHAALTIPAENKIHLWGIEEKGLYLQHVAAFKEAILKEKEAAHCLIPFEENLSRLKEKKFNPRLKEFEFKRNAYQTGKINLGAYVKYLAEKSETKKYPNIQLFLSALALETAIQPDKLAIEKKELKAHLEKGGLSAELVLSQWPQINRSMKALSLSSSIQVDPFQEELSKLEENLKNLNIQTSEEKKLLQEEKELYLKKKLIHFSLSPKEWDEYINLKTHSFISTEPFEKFDRAALSRNKVLVENLLDRLSQEKNSTYPVAVLIAGGFHTPGITQLLKEKKIGYAVLTPKLKNLKGSGTDYLQYFQRDKTPLEKLFTSERITLSPERVLAAQPMGKATGMRDAIAPLYITLKADGLLLKKARLRGNLENSQAQQIQRKINLFLKSGNFKTVSRVKIRVAKEILKRLPSNALSLEYDLQTNQGDISTVHLLTEKSEPVVPLIQETPVAQTELFGIIIRIYPSALKKTNWVSPLLLVSSALTVFLAAAHPQIGALIHELSNWLGGYQPGFSVNTLPFLPFFGMTYNDPSPKPVVSDVKKGVVTEEERNHLVEKMAAVKSAGWFFKDIVVATIYSNAFISQIFNKTNWPSQEAYHQIDTALNRLLAQEPPAKAHRGRRIDAELISDEEQSQAQRMLEELDKAGYRLRTLQSPLGVSHTSIARYKKGSKKMAKITFQKLFEFYILVFQNTEGLETKHLENEDMEVIEIDSSITTPNPQAEFVQNEADFLKLYLQLTQEGLRDYDALNRFIRNPFSSTVGRLLALESFLGDSHKAVNYFLNELELQNKNVEEILIKIAGISHGINSDPLAKKFVVAAAKLYAKAVVKNEKSSSNRLLPQGHATGTYLDLGSGTNFLLFMPNLRSEISYQLVDQSLFVTAYLEELAQLLGKENVQVTLENMENLTFNENSIGTVRAKNLNNFFNPPAGWWENVSSWIMPEGQLILQGDVDSSIFAHNRLNLLCTIQELYETLVLQEGWSFDFSLGVANSDTSKDTFDTIIFTKPFSGQILRSPKRMEEFESGMVTSIVTPTQPVLTPQNEEISLPKNIDDLNREPAIGTLETRLREEMEQQERFKNEDSRIRLEAAYKIAKLRGLFSKNIEKHHASLTARIPKSYLPRLFQYLSQEEFSSTIATLEQYAQSKEEVPQKQLELATQKIIRAHALLETIPDPYSEAVHPEWNDLQDGLSSLLQYFFPHFHVRSKAEAQAIRKEGQSYSEFLKSLSLKQVKGIMLKLLSQNRKIPLVNLFDLSETSEAEISMLATTIQLSYGQDRKVIVPLLTKKDLLDPKDLENLKERLRGKLFQYTDAMLENVSFGEVVLTGRDLKANPKQAGMDPSLEMNPDAIYDLLQRKISNSFDLKIFTDNPLRFKESWQTKSLQIMLIASATQVLILTQDLWELFKSNKLYSENQ